MNASLPVTAFAEALAAERHVDEKDVQAAIAIVNGRVLLLRPVPTLEARHEWLRGMLTQLLRATRHVYNMRTVCFVLSTSDWPLLNVASTPTGRLLVLGATTHADGSSGDIPVPNGAFEDRVDGSDYDDFLARSASLGALIPWQARSKRAFFRGTMSCAISGEECKAVPRTQFCPRLEVAALSRSHPALIDAGLTGRYEPAYDQCIASFLGDAPYTSAVPMVEHARYRYLLQLGGQTYSYRLQRILPLGSVVLAESINYDEWYTPALIEARGVVPFSCNGSSSGGSGPCGALLDLVERAQSSDEVDAELHAVAERGSSFARTYLTSVARSCYWTLLLRAVQALLPVDDTGGPSLVARRSTVASDLALIRLHFPHVVELTLERPGWASFGHWWDSWTQDDGYARGELRAVPFH